MGKDNTTLDQKVGLRRFMLERMCETSVEPVIMETHGGVGQVWAQVYASIPDGVVFEKDEDKAGVLAQQRPTWAVYEADCEKALAAGAGAHLEVTVLDVDPYGSPWPTFEAFFASDRPRAPVLWCAVNDGLRQSCQYHRAWTTKALAPAVDVFGNDMHDRYLEVCQFLLKRQAAHAGYNVRRFAGYYCGKGDKMTHYLAELVREQGGDHA